MSAQEQDPVVPIGPDFATEGVAGISTLYAYDTSAAVAMATTTAEADAVIDDIIASVSRLYDPEASSEINGVWLEAKAAIDDGTLTPAELPGFFSYLRYNLGIPVLTTALLAAGGLAALLLKYKLHLGYDLEPMPLPHVATTATAPVQPTVAVPLAPTPKPVPNPNAPVPVTTSPVPVPPSPPVVSPPVVTPPSPVTGSPQPSAPVTVGQPTTAGQSLVVQAGQGVVNQTVTAPGLTLAEAKAISTSLGISVANVYGVMAKAFDLMLPNMAPGQVPEALTDLFNAVATLESQVSPIISGIRDNGGMATGDQLQAAQGALQALMAQVGTTEAQLGDQAPSELQTEITALQAKTTADSTTLSGIEAVLPTLATGAAVAAVAAEVTTTSKQLAGTAESTLGTELAATTATANEALRVAEDAETCCNAQTENLNNDVNDLGGPSALKSLGQLAGLAFGLTFLAGLVDTAVAVFDLPAAIFGTVADVGTISGYADKVANQVMANTSWADSMAA